MSEVFYNLCSSMWCRIIGSNMYHHHQWRLPENFSIQSNPEVPSHFFTPGRQNIVLLSLWPLLNSLSALLTMKLLMMIVCILRMVEEFFLDAAHFRPQGHPSGMSPVAFCSIPPETGSSVVELLSIWKHLNTPASLSPLGHKLPVGFFGFYSFQFFYLLPFLPWTLWQWFINLVV